MLKVAKTLELKDAQETESAVILGEDHPELKQDNSNACEPLIWGKEFTCTERKKVIEICAELWGEDKKIKMANNLMAVFAWESGGTFKTNVPNMGNSGATGLIQFMPKTAASLLGYGKDVDKITIEYVKNYWGNGKTLKRVKEFADMTVLEQLDYVKKYFKPKAGKDMEFVDFYLQVLFPVSSGKEEHVVFSKDGLGLDVNDEFFQKRIDSYAQNSGMDIDKNGKLLKSEIAVSVQKYIIKGKPEANDCTDGSCTLSSGLHDGKKIEIKNLNGWPVEKKYKTWVRRIDSGVEKRNVSGIETASKNHKGLDINFSGGGNTDRGATVFTTHDGTAFIKDNTTGSGGRYIEITSTNKKFMTRYLHLSKIIIKQGQKVLKGQQIGNLGGSYYSKEIHDKMKAHLHYEIRTIKNHSYDNVIDPLEGKSYKPTPEKLLNPQDWIDNPSSFKY